MDKNENNNTEKTEITEKQKKEDNSKKYDLNSTKDLFELFREEKDEEIISKHIATHISKLQKDNHLEEYQISLLYDEYDSISFWHSNRIYEAVSATKKEKDIFLLIHSNGGQIEPAYLISKTCKRLAKSTFIVTVPRRAKSAATLISLGADQIHMGLMSELGPIDPQFGGYPALGLSNALQTLAKLCTKYPESSQMFASYLTQTLNLKDLGYFERITESAAQYAERLLSSKKFPREKTATKLADHFVNHYKDHSFVIDFDEATSLLGNDIVKKETKEYTFSNEIYQFLDLVKLLFRLRFKKDMSYVGDIKSGIYLTEKEEN